MKWYLRFILTLIISICSVGFSQSRYTITSIMEILKPINLDALTTDAQSYRVINENNSTITVEITTDPTYNQITNLQPNKNWKLENTNDPALSKYLAAGVTTNWDSEMQSQLLAVLAQDGIYPDQLTDVELVQKVSQWIFRGNRFKFKDHFISYDVQFSNGQVSVIPQLQSHFESQKVQNGFATDDEAIAVGIFGKSMFNARVYGNCTFSATLQATILKALGIPTRLVVNIPVIDWNNQAQWNIASSQIHQFAIRKTVLKGLAQQSIGSWGSHTFNEVYVGHKWIRLNYTNLGQTPADPMYFGLMLQVVRVSDWSEAHLGNTWGVHAQVQNLAQLTSNNPYRSLGIRDTINLLNENNNPPVDDLKVISLDKAYNSDDATLPNDVRANLLADPSFAVVINSGYPPVYSDIALFRRNVSRNFILRAEGYPDLKASDAGSWTNQDFTAIKIKPQNMNDLVSDVEYSIVPLTNSGNYHWEVSSGLKVVKPKLN